MEEEEEEGNEEEGEEEEEGDAEVKEGLPASPALERVVIA